MKDGEIIQVGTPEALVLDPATDYVAEFTKEIPRAKVLSAQAVMSPLGSGQCPSGSVPWNTKVADLAERLVDSEEDLAVTDAEDRPIGRLDRRAVLDVLVGRKSGS
jgi:glycine betaine/proline transport system ATP-binding protein